MRPLVQLSNGDWAHPDVVRGIFAFSRSDLGNPDRVNVCLANGMIVVSNFESFEDATEYRDSLAATVNRREDEAPAGETGGEL